MFKLILSALFLIMIFSNPAICQDQCDPLDDPNCEFDPDEEVPLDSGVSVLIVLTAIYGGVLIKSKRLPTDT